MDPIAGPANDRWSPTARQLRQFAVTSLIMLPLAGWLFNFSTGILSCLVAVALGMCVIAWFRPRALLPIYLGLMLVAFPIGLVVGEVAMLAVYVGVFLPIGLGLRWLGHDPLQLKLDRHRNTYWQAVERPHEYQRRSSMEESRPTPAPEYSSTFWGELKQLIVEEKKWWLVPILISLALVGLLIILSATGAAPFIYTIF